MPLIATHTHSRLAIAPMLALAVSGGVIRHYAASPSTLHDIGTLLLVLWLPAVGNLIAFLIRQLPRREPPPTDFPAGSAFQPQLQVQFDPVLAGGLTRVARSKPSPKGALLVGRRCTVHSLEEMTMAKGDQRSNKMVKKPKKDHTPPKEGGSTSDRPMPPVTTVMPKGKLKNK